MVKEVIAVFTPCSSSKDDSTPIPHGSKIITPSHYLDDKTLISDLVSIRESIFQDPRTMTGTRTTYAFDLYVKAGYVYRDLRKDNYQQLRNSLLLGVPEWFFLSGGYGVIHALEPAREYQATFNKGIAYQKGIPLTARLWKNTLTETLDAIISKLEPEWIYAFGSRDYTDFIKQTRFWKAHKTRLFESTGISGPHWLSPKLNELAKAILDGTLNQLNEKYEAFTKQS